MSPEESRKQQNKQRPSLPRVIEDLLERLREGLEQVAEELRPREPQPVRIPVPVERPRRR